MLQCSKLKFWSSFPVTKNRYLKMWCNKTALNLILWFKCALSVAKRNWDARLDLSIHKFASHQPYYLIIEVLFTIALHNIYKYKYIYIYISHTFVTARNSWKQTYRKSRAARLRHYYINYTGLIFDGVFCE